MADLTTQLPWQHEQWSRVQRQREAGQLPHALLLAGPPAVGKRQFARAFGAAQLCLQPTAGGAACGQCRGCALLLAGTHPDLLWVQPEETGKAVKIDQVRAVVEFMAQTAQQGGRKLVVVEPAEAMNRNAANALLKTLEEPTANALLMLVTDAPGRLLPTIRSRCQRLDFPVPPDAVVREWLALRNADAGRVERALSEAGGRPLLASDLLDGPGFDWRNELTGEFAGALSGQQSALAVAERWQAHGWLDLLQWLHSRLAAALRTSQAAAPAADQAVQQLAQVQPAALFALLDQLGALINQTLAGTNPNRQLALECFLFAACDAIHKKRR